MSDDNDSIWNVLSPLYEIIQRLKRKNSVTAAASTLSQHINLVENARSDSDQWGSFDEGLDAPIDEMSSFNVYRARVLTESPLGPKIPVFLRIMTPA
jgi:hypothetical protein